MEDEVFYPSFEIREKPYSESEWQQIGENLDRLARESMKKWVEKDNERMIRAMLAIRIERERDESKRVNGDLS